MRCSCPECDTYMVHAESLRLGCVCPNCGARCTACLGTDTVISRESLRRMKDTPWFTPSFEGAQSGGGVGGEIRRTHRRGFLRYQGR